MHDTDWLLIDIETTGITQPIVVVEIAASTHRDVKAHKVWSFSTKSPLSCERSAKWK